MLLDCRGKCLGFFSEVVTPALISEMSREDQKTILFELEGLAFATGISLFRQRIARKRLIIFTDNQAVQACLLKCISSNDHMDLIIKDVCRTEERLNLISCIERVPSQSNPSDVLSRELVHKFLGVDRSSVDLCAMWRQCLDAILEEGRSAMASDRRL